MEVTEQNKFEQFEVFQDYVKRIADWVIEYQNMGDQAKADEWAGFLDKMTAYIKETQDNLKARV